jgi:hypothetical protein
MRIQTRSKMRANKKNQENQAVRKGNAEIKTTQHNTEPYSKMDIEQKIQKYQQSSKSGISEMEHSLCHFFH